MRARRGLQADRISSHRCCCGWALQAREPLLWEHYVVGLLRERLPPTSWKLFTTIRTTFVYADGAMQVRPVAVWSPYPSEPYLRLLIRTLILLSRTLNPAYPYP